MGPFLLAIDQGTTSTRAMIFNREGKCLCEHHLEVTPHFPHDAWVEQDPEEIWKTTVTCCRKAITNASLRPADILAIGISNQRETTLLWDKKTGKPIYRAIVWQDRRTADYCQKLAAQPGLAEKITQKTGLLLDPYFSATKIKWLLDNIEGAREKADRGELAFGTVDSYLLWQLTGGKQHATDATNASRTLLFNIHTQEWDDELLDLFGIPRSLLPKVFDNCAPFGVTTPDVLGYEIPITAMIGDQQAATVGQACFKPGMVKSTYGTGCFVLMNTGDKPVASKNRLLTTTAYRINGKVTYGLEGSIFIAGAAVKWLRDTIHLIKTVQETERMASVIPDNGDVYFVPAFTGLGAPHWDPYARGALLGLTRDTQVEHIVRAALEAVCYQTRDLLQAMTNDGAGAIQTLRVDGGMSANPWLLQFLSDMLQTEVDRPKYIETSALGAAYLAGLGMGIYDSLDEISQLWQLDQQYTPHMENQDREKFYRGWQKAVLRVTTPQKNT